MDPGKTVASQRWRGAQRVPNASLELFIARRFFPPELCRSLIALIDFGRRPSTIADDSGASGFRTSETCDLDSRHADVAAADRLIDAMLGLQSCLGEPLQGQRYLVGQEFKAHTDSFNPGGMDYFVHCADSGQRTWTAMVYLNQPEAGGATRFKAIGKTIQAETGKLVAWNNLLPDGCPNPHTMHQGMKVRGGRKYIVTKWYRERPYRHPG